MMLVITIFTCRGSRLNYSVVVKSILHTHAGDNVGPRHGKKFEADDLLCVLGADFAKSIQKCRDLCRFWDDMVHVMENDEKLVHSLNEGQSLFSMSCFQLIPCRDRAG